MILSQRNKSHKIIAIPSELPPPRPSSDCIILTKKKAAGANATQWWNVRLANAKSWVRSLALSGKIEGAERVREGEKENRD